MPTARRHPRLRTAVRKTVKWGGAGLTVLLVVVWVGSRWWAAGWIAPDRSSFGFMTGGAIGQEAMPGAERQSEVRSVFGRHDESFKWWFESGLRSGSGYVFVPLWLPVLLSVLATAAAWRADAKYIRRAREGACPACGYDRAGLAAGAVCPECGKQPEAR